MSPTAATRVRNPVAIAIAPRTSAAPATIARVSAYGIFISIMCATVPGRSVSFAIPLIRKIAASALSRLASAAAPDDPIKLPPLEAPSEKPRPEPPQPRSPDKRLGVALVGLGHISLEQVLPAFGQSREAKLVGLVSGDPRKA